MEWVEVGASDGFPEGGLRVDVAGHRLAVYRIEGELYVIGDRCSHQEASLAEGELFDYDVECPRHGSEFDVRTGRPGSLPATRPVPSYQVREEDGKVMVQLEPDLGED